MNEEKDLSAQIKIDEATETDQAEITPTVTEHNSSNFRQRIMQPRFIAFFLIGLVIISIAVIYLISIRNSQSGRAVPAPRNVSFGQSETNQESSTLPAEETLTLAPEQIEQLKFEVATVGETLSAEVEGAASTGVVKANAYAETPVFSLVGGVVRNMSTELGEYVQKGKTIAVVQSDELAKVQSDYLSMVAESEEADKRYERALQLTEIASESRDELDMTVANVKAVEAELAEYQSNFERTQKLVKIGAASRQEMEQATTKLRTAEANLIEAKNRFDRAGKLLNINPQRRAELDAALTQKRSTEAKANAERQRLFVLGLSAQQVNQLKNTRQISSELPITSPVSGTVTARSVNSGEVISANKELLKVTNLSTVWVIAEVFEKDLRQISVGSGASVTSDAYPERIFRGRVTYIDPNINQTTRTAQVRVELENPGQIFKVEMYVKVAFGSLGTAERTTPIVPSSAVQTVNNQQVIFLATEKPNVFLLRKVRLGAEINGQNIVLEGVNVGDKIITEGSFLLRAEWIKQHPGN